MTIPRYNGNTNRRSKRRNAYDRSTGAEPQTPDYDEWEKYTRALAADVHHTPAQPGAWTSQSQ